MRTAIAVVAAATLSFCVAPKALCRDGWIFEARLDSRLVTQGGYAYCGAMGDFNGDGREDWAVGTDESTVDILLGTGNGLFVATVAYDLDDYPYWIAVGEFDEDEHEDLAVGTASTWVDVFLGNGDGTFEAPVPYEVSEPAVYVAVGDLDGNGDQDLVLGAEGPTLDVLLGNGDGTFQPPATYALTDQGRGIAFGDFDEDENQDVVVATYSSVVDVLLGNGDGVLQPLTTLAVSDRSRAVAVGDFDEDGHQDLAVGTSVSLDVLFGNGDGTFESPTSYASDFYVYDVGVGDLDGDEHEDIAVGAQGELTPLIGDGAGGFQPRESFDLPGSLEGHLGIADFDEDGKQDMAVVCDQGVVCAFRGCGDGIFVTTPRYQLDAGGFGIVSGYFDADGNVDVAVTLSVRGEVSVLLGQEDESFLPPTSYGAGDGPQDIAVGRFDDDAFDDLAVANRYGSDVSILLGDGNGGFELDGSYAVGEYPRGIAVGRFDGDAEDDLVVADGSAGVASLSLLLGNGDGSFQPALDVATGALPVAVAPGNLNGDNATDLVVACIDSLLRVLIGNGDGSFEEPILHDLDGRVRAVVVGRLDGDLVNDVAAATDQGLAVLLGNGDGTLQDPVWWRVDYASGIVCDDLDSDGLNDLAVLQRNGGNVAVFVGHGDGTFDDPVLYGAGSYSRSITACDVGGDGDVDLAAANDWSRDVGLLRNLTVGSPVEGAFYGVLTEAGTVLLRWTVESLAGMEGLRVYRSTSAAGPFVRLNDDPLPAVSPGSFEDTGIWPETTFWYELRAVLLDGSEDVVGTQLASATTEGRLVARLHAPRPNPFARETNLVFDVPADGTRVIVRVYNVRGQEVVELVDRPLSRGRHEVRWSGTSDGGVPVAGGVYFLRLRAGGHEFSRKVLLVR